MRFSVKRVYGEGLLIGFNGLLSLAFFLVKDPKVDITFDVIGIDGKGFLEGLQRFIVVSFKEKEDSKIIIAFFIFWVDFGGFLIESKGPVHLSQHLVDNP